MQWLDRILPACAIALAGALAASAGPAAASTYFDNNRGEISARMSTQNSFQHNGADNINWVQWRNELRFDLKYELLPYGESLGILKTANFNMLYRARYDAVYDIRDSYGRRGYDRDDFRFPEGKYPRELFMDFGFSGFLEPLSVRLGRQHVVWGEADLFRSLDVVNPLNITQNGIVGEDFADYREPLWIAKFLWQIGELGPISQAGLEFFYSPNSIPFADRRMLITGDARRIHTDTNNVIDGFDRHTVLPFKQIRHPWEIVRIGSGRAFDGRTIDAPSSVINQDGSFSDFIYQISQDYDESDIDWSRSMAGVRLIGTSFANVYFTLNYLFKRTDSAAAAVDFADIFDPSLPGTGAVQPDVLNRAIAAVGTPDLNGNGFPDGVEQQLADCLARKSPELMLVSIRSDPTNPDLQTPATSTGCLGIPVIHPWTHIIGFTLTYNDYDWTGAILRMEQSFSTKEPGEGISPNNPSRVEQGCGVTGEGLGCKGVPGSRDFETRNVRTTQMWRSMIGFDYLRSLAPMQARNFPNPIRSLLADQWFFTAQFLTEYRAHADGQVGLTTSFTDRQQHWHPLLTFAATGFFMNQRLRPLMAFGYEVNQEFPLAILQADYFLTEKLVVRVGEILYMGSTQSQVNSFLNYYANRDTTYIRLTYFLL
jgi:hypothetical protein